MEFKDFDYDLKNEVIEYRDCGKDDLYKFLLYKSTATRNHFDCDRCSYAKKVYKKLWGFDNSINTDFQKIIIGSNEIIMGMDTMNSFWNTFAWSLNKWCSDDLQLVFGISHITLKNVEMLIGNYEALKRILIKNLSEAVFMKLLMFAKLTHTIGNFILIPRSLPPYTTEENTFNTARCALFNDYFDLSLQCFLNNDVPIWNRTLVKIYADKFLLNDYINTNLDIIPFNECHSKIINDGAKIDNRPQTIPELSALLDTINNRIIHRGKEMYHLLSGESTKEPSQQNHSNNELNEDKYKGKEKKLFVKSFFIALITCFLFIAPVADELIQTLLLALDIGRIHGFVLETLYNIILLVVCPVLLSYKFAKVKRKKHINSSNLSRQQKEIKIKHLHKGKFIIISFISSTIFVVFMAILTDCWNKSTNFEMIIRNGLINTVPILSIFVAVYSPIFFFGFKRKCLNCRTLFALKKLETKQYNSEDIQIKVENEIKNNLGEKTGTQEQWVNGERVFYKTKYECKVCGQIHYSVFSEDYIKK